MDVKTLKTSSTLSGDSAADLYADFRKRVSGKKAVVERVVAAFTSQDPEAFFKSIDGQIGDGAFDTAIVEAFDRGEIEAELHHGLMYSLLEAASAVTEHDESGHSFTTTELFALPITGTIEEILEVTGSFEKLAALASVFSTTGYVAEGVQIIISPTTIDPRAAARLKCAIAQEMAEAFVPHFTHGYTPSDAEDLFEFIQGGFEFLGDPDIDHLSEKGRVTRLAIGATRRIHSTHYPTTGDAFIANFIDENESDELHEISDIFLEMLNEAAPGTIAYNLPMTLTRGAAFAALGAVVEGLNDEAALLGARRSDFLMDEMSIARHGETVSVEGQIGDHQLGPVVVQDLLVRRDRLWFRNSLSRLCDDLHETSSPVRRRVLN